MRHLLITALLLLTQALYAGGRCVNVANQKQFDVAVERINKGEEMHLCLKKGLYVLNKSVNARAPLSIESCGAATITSSDEYRNQDRIGVNATHDVYRIKTAPSTFALLYDSEGKILPVSESVLDDAGVNYLEGKIQAPSEYVAGTEIKIQIPSNLVHLKNKTFPRAFGYLDCGWKVVPFELVKSDKKFFYCKTLDECPTKDYQYDRNFYKKQVRFVMFNAEIKPGSVYYDNERIYVPKGVDRFFFLNSQEKGRTVPSITTGSDAEFRNIGFDGFGGITVNSNAAGRCEIVNCRFRNILGFALKVVKENGPVVRPANVKGCTFTDCSIYRDNILIVKSGFEGRSCVTVSNCVLTRHSEDRVYYKNASGALWVDGDAVVENNVIYNTCRCHLYMNKGEIVARGNVMYNTDGFNSRAERNLSGDWGVVYCNHIFYNGNNTERALENKQHHILLESNMVYGAVAYGGDARGIYIDNGRGDVECRDNVVLNVQGYSIDTYNSPLTNASAVRNSYSGNIVTSKYRLLSGSAVTGSNVPVTRKNMVVSTEANKISNIRVAEDDVRLDDVDASATCSGGKIRVNEGLYKVMKKSPAWKEIKKYVEK